MGLKNRVPIFQRVIEHCLDPVADVADPYVDDIITGTEVTQPDPKALLLQHDADIRKVLRTLEEQELIADIKKCRFFVKEVAFCGHILGNGTRRPEPGKSLALEKGRSRRP
jgi:hypothetical protein